MQVECIRCNRLRSDKYMEEAVFPKPPHKGAGVYRCAAKESCKDARKKCGKCGHKVTTHTYTDRWFGGKVGVYCMANMGMGDPCGCEAYNI